MNMHVDAMPEARTAAPAAVPLARQVYWSLRRELWENRSLYLAPLAVAAVFLFGFAMSATHLAQRVRAVSSGTPAQQHEVIGEPYAFAALVMMGITLLVGVFYCLDALYGERRDRSILFWKSLPVSDAVTVLTKAGVPLVLLPLIAVALTLVVHIFMRLLGGAVLLGSGQSAGILREHAPLLPMTGAMFYHMVVVHALWHAPFYAWLLLVSAWARRAPVLWAVLPPLAVGVVEKLVFNTSYFGGLLGSLVSGGTQMGDSSAPAVGAPGNPLMHLGHGAPLSSPALWLGLALTAGFLFAAIRLRRQRGPN